jgi:hypothetical protein
MTISGIDDAMTGRTVVAPVRFRRPFALRTAGGTLPAGEYQVQTSEELILGVSFAAYRRVSTTLFLPAGSTAATAREFATVDAAEFDEAKRRDGLG